MIVYHVGVTVCHRETLWQELWHNWQYAAANLPCNTSVWMIPGTHVHADNASMSLDAIRYNFRP